MTFLWCTKTQMRKKLQKLTNNKYIKHWCKVVLFCCWRRIVYHECDVAGVSAIVWAQPDVISPHKMSLSQQPSSDSPNGVLRVAQIASSLNTLYMRIYTQNHYSMKCHSVMHLSLLCPLATLLLRIVWEVDWRQCPNSQELDYLSLYI